MELSQKEDQQFTIDQFIPSGNDGSHNNKLNSCLVTPVGKFCPSIPQFPLLIDAQKSPLPIACIG
jgi:hypothetical protein